MAKGITIESGSPRTLSLEGVEVAQGGSANQAGLYAVGSKLYLDGEEIADAQGGTGLLISNGEVTFNGEAVGGDTPPTPPTPTSRLWIPPAQPESNYLKWTYRQFIAAYDELMTDSAYPGIIKKYEYVETENGTKTEGGHEVPDYQHSFVLAQSGDYNENGSAYGGYPLYHYEFTPANYTKTFFVQASIHGNEHDPALTIHRFFDIICNHASESDYSRLAELRDNVRFIVIPVVNPYGYDNRSMNVPYTNWFGEEMTGTQMLNCNRNFDCNLYYGIAGSGNGGNYPFQVAEDRHVDALVDLLSPQNIDYFMDNHDDTRDNNSHFWFNFNADAVNAPVMKTLLADLIEYEEELRIAGGTDYRHFESADADELGYVHPNVADASGTTGTAATWSNFTKGMLGSVCEYIGGYFGYSFGTISSEQATRSLRIRANLLVYAYEMIHTKGWLVNESADAGYFHFDNPVSMTRQGLRKDLAYSEYCDCVVSIDEVYQRWDKLASANPSYISKSALLGQNSSGDDIYSYTLGNGSKKVLFIGGNMRWGVAHKETEFGIYLLAEYLCNAYIVNQSAFLKRLKDDYTIIVLPCIDVRAGDNTQALGPIGLNAAGIASRAKWKEVEGKCVPTSFALNTAADVPIFLSWLSANQDACVLVSGGEDTSSYSYERPKYATDYMTQFVIPRTQTIQSWLTGYCTHLEDDRGENEPSVVRTSSVADATYGNIGLTCGDYAYDNYGIPAYFVNLKVSNKWAERQEDMRSGDTASNYMYRTYETGRRIANIVNVFLMAGGDIAAGGGLVNKND